MFDHFFRSLALCICISSLLPNCASGEETFRLGSSISVCIDPPSSGLAVRSEFEGNYRSACKTWSRYASPTAVVGVDSFRNCDPKTPAVNLYAGRIVSQWTGQQISLVTTAALFDNPTYLRLRELRTDESRSDALIVWRDGVVGVVLQDDQPVGAAPVDLARVSVLYPSFERCGSLFVRNGQELDVRMPSPGKFKLLVADRPEYYWNHWIEGNGHDSQSDPISADGDYYTYRIDFSPLDFGAFLKNPGATRAAYPAKDAAKRAAALRLSGLKVVVLASGVAQLLGNDDDPKLAAEFGLQVDSQRLSTALSARSVGAYESLTDLADAQGALRMVTPSSMTNRVSLTFFAAGPGCGSLKTIIWKEADGLTSIVGSWSRGFRAVSEASGGRMTISEDDGCGESEEVAIRLDPSAIPRLGSMRGPGADARLTFLDLGRSTVGVFELISTPSPQYYWILEKRLREHLPRVVTEIDGDVGSRDFDVSGISGKLAEMLFQCRHPENCQGQRAFAELKEIASRQALEPPRIEAVFNDSRGRNYYVPIQLLAANDGQILGNRIRPIHNLPFTQSGRVHPPCVRHWSAGLIVKDQLTLTEDWRKGWIQPLLASGRHVGSGFYSLDELRGYLRRSERVAEGFVLLAHHGRGDIGDSEKTPPMSRVVPDNIQRVFGDGSFGFLAACSVGALGEDFTDPATRGNGNSALLNMLNLHNLQAAIVSPFKVPEPVAKIFLDKFSEVVTKLPEDRSLYSVFESVRKLVKEQAGTQSVASGADMFMLVGDGDISVCKP